MVENKLIFKDKKLSNIDSHILGISGENEQEILIFSFEDGFVDGTCYLELILPNGEKGFIELEKDVDNKCYKLLVKNSLLAQEGIIKMQLKIAQNKEVWKSKDFEMHVLYAINATETIKEDYTDFVSFTNQRLDKLEKNIEDKADKKYVDKAIENIEILEESDPTVPDWAKEPKKPTYTAEEVGALSGDTELFSGNYEDLNSKPSIPESTSDLVNNSGFIDNTVNDLINYYLKSEIYTKEEVNSLIGAITTMNIQKVETLPTQNISTTTIYFVPKTSAKTQDVYDEYVYINENWEHIGSTEIDLTGYATEEWVNIQIADFLTESEVSTLISSALESYYNKTEIDNELTKRDTEITTLKEENEILKNQIPNRTSRRGEYNLDG